MEAEYISIHCMNVNTRHKFILVFDASIFILFFILPHCIKYSALKTFCNKTGLHLVSRSWK